MKSFFLLASKSGRPIAGGELDRFRAIIDRTISYAGFVRSCQSCVNDAGSACLVALTNEPEVTPLLEHDDLVLAVCGDCHDGTRLQNLRATERLALNISGITGRFSAAVMDRRSGIVAVANSAVRIDSVFAAESRDFHFIGTQASTLCHLLHGELRYDVEALYSFIGKGFFGTDATSFIGVSALSPLTAWLVDGGLARRHTTHLGELKTGEGQLDELIDGCLDAYLDAVKPLANSGRPVRLSLSGGKDSRLVLVALRRAGIDLHCYTVDRGADNSADVYVATQLAKLLNVSHQVYQVATVSSGDKPWIRVDLLERTATALRASDGAVFGYDRAVFRPQYSPRIDLTGHGGEVMRGGYAAHHTRPLGPKDALKIARRLFLPAASLYWKAASERYGPALTDWVEQHAARMPPHDVLDCLYVYFRCGRWIAGASRGTTTATAKLYPFLDNRVALALVRAPAAQKIHDRLIRGMVRRLDAVAADLPVANDQWRDAEEDELRRVAAAHPGAFTSAADKPNLDWRLHIAPPIMEHVRQYCVEDGRVELLSAIVDPAAVARFLHGPEAARPDMRTVLFGLYAACVLTSGDWLRAPFPSAPLQVPLSPAA